MRTVLLAPIQAMGNGTSGRTLEIALTACKDRDDGSNPGREEWNPRQDTGKSTYTLPLREASSEQIVSTLGCVWRRAVPEKRTNRQEQVDARTTASRRLGGVSPLRKMVLYK